MVESSSPAMDAPKVPNSFVPMGRRRSGVRRGHSQNKVAAGSGGGSSDTTNNNNNNGTSSKLPAATTTTTVAAQHTPALTAPSVPKSTKSTLLKYGIMPDYRIISQSNELLENFLARPQNIEHPLRDLEDTCHEPIVILTSLFKDFCHPSPSIDSISNIYLLEYERVKSLVSKSGIVGMRSSFYAAQVGGNITSLGTPNSNQEQLPKDTLVHTSYTSAHFLIKLIRTNPKSCLLKLPLEFQLAFFRILTRLLTEEGDEEYDEECLFDWSSLEKGGANGGLGGGGGGGQATDSFLKKLSEDYNSGEEFDSEEEEEDEFAMVGKYSVGIGTSDRSGYSSGGSSYGRSSSFGGEKLSSFGNSNESRANVERRKSFGAESSHNRPSVNRNASSSSIANNHRDTKTDPATTTASSGLSKQSSSNSFFRASSTDNTGKAFEAWSYARWKKKKSAPLYSVIRFCNNPQWKDDDVARKTKSRRSERSTRSLRSASHLKWSFVGDNVKLSLEEEEAILGEDDMSDEEEMDEGGEEETTTSLVREDMIGILIRIFQAILDKCTKGGVFHKQDGQYLLLGPVAHLIGLVCATRVSVKNLRLLFVLAEDTSQKKPNHSVLVLGRLHILRALRYAAEYSIQCNGALDKPGPQTFFSFGKEVGRRGGLSAMFNLPWPFKYDFGMACWFRAESFCANNSDDGKKEISRHVVLFSTRTQSGAQIEVSFEAHSTESTAAATLIVTVIDASNDPKDKKSLRKVRLVGCVLSPMVWYHVAVRLSRPRLSRFSLSSFSNKDEVSIFLNGKLMLKEQMKMPQLPPDIKNVGKGVIGGFGSFSQSIPGKALPLEISFFSNFDGQAGSLYVFKDHVSEESINALYHETIEPSEQGNLSHFGSFVDRWDGNHGKLNHLTKAVSSASMHASDLGDVVLPNFSMFTGDVTQQRKILFDLAEEDDVDSDQIPAGLSRAAFGSKLLLVWDPCRFNHGTLLDPYQPTRVTVENGVSTWSFESVRDTIESLGGMQRLLPLFGVLQHFPLESERSLISRGLFKHSTNLLVPSLIFLVSSFIREHEINACELFRCGGINVIEKLLFDYKKKDIDAGVSYRLGVSPEIARFSASALLDIWQASRLNLSLEMTVFSRLLFNIKLGLGGVAKSPGVSFHAVMLPILSEIAMMNPNKVRDCVGTGEIFDVVNQYSSFESEEAESESAENELFSQQSEFYEFAMTTAERCFVVDTLLGMIVMMLSQKCPTQDLYSLLTFITYNLDIEWESKSSETEGSVNQPTKSGIRYLTTVKAVSILFFLLQKPSVPNLIDSLGEVFENGSSVASWMLCCLVNSYDDTIRGLGIKCLAAYLRTTTAPIDGQRVSLRSSLRMPSSQVGATNKISKTMKLGLDYANNMLTSALSGRGNPKITYKLLWHLLKCHRERLGDASFAALNYLIVDDISAFSSSVPLTDIIVPNSDTLGGFRLNLEELNDQSTKIDSSQSIRNKYGVGTVLRLLRFLSNDQKERWLFDILAFLLASPESVDIIVACDDWQPVLFQLVAEVLEEIYGTDGASSVTSDDDNSSNGETNKTSRQTTVNTETLSRPSVRTRYDLSLKLYSTLLGYCVRYGDDENTFDAIEMAAALQRVDCNGAEIFSILLSHLFADLIEKGTIGSVERTYSNTAENAGAGRNRALKQSAKLVTQAILSNGSSGLDMASAVKQWRCLRHLTALTVAVVNENGFGIVQLFDYRNQDASAIDSVTGGMYGIRLDNLVSGVNAFEALAGAKLHTNSSGRHKRDRFRYVSVVLASQVLTLLDAFIFPDNLDTSKAASQLHGLALVRSTEPRLGQSQGTLLASLVRLSLILLAYLEPSSVKFLQACSRLRCFLHWVLEILRESVALGGYSEAFNELTAPLDRVVLAIVLQCHRALSRCSVVLVEMESSPWQKYFSDVESRQKSQRRLFRAILELREIVLAAYRGRNEVLKTALSPKAHEALTNSMEEIAKSTTPKSGESSSKEASLRSFLENGWVADFHDVEVNGDLVIPEQISNGQVYQGRKASMRGRQAVEELASESTAMIKEYTNLLNAPFTVYCENQRKWAETDAVRDREYEGDVSVKRLSNKFSTDLVELNKSTAARFLLALNRVSSVSRLVNDPWTRPRHWMFTSHTDLLYRRIVFHPNDNFDDHAEASYELSLGKEREIAEREREAERKRFSMEALQKATALYSSTRHLLVDIGEDSEESSDESDDSDETDDEGFLGWGAESEKDLFDHPECNENEDTDYAQPKHESDESHEHTPDDKPVDKDDDEGNEKVEDKDKVEDDQDKVDESEWDQIDSSDFDQTNETDPFAWARKFMWAEGERFVHNFDSVVIVSLRTTIEGTLLLTSHSIYFHQTGDTIDVMSKEKMVSDGKNASSRQDRKWKLNRLTDVHGRRYMLKAQALELFFANMEGVFFTFNGVKERDLFHSKLRSNCKAPLLRSFKSLNPRVVFKKSKLTDLWRKRRISNYQYIMALNLMAGRTFNDITQYPVFPWILSDYTSDTLDLSDPKVYRDLSKPIGALNPERLEQLLERYESLDGFPDEEKFLYGSHYSSPGVVLHYLIRQEPYTSMHIALQSGRFDCPDRLFFDIGGSWKSCNTSTSDVKELVPEFFTCPEMFTNTNNFPLGETQEKLPIDYVKLPPWSKGSPHEFVRLHRLALESEYVSQNLHHWVDLIFGCKQRGPAALEANNLFHPFSYEGSVDIDKVTDEVQRQAIEGHIQNFGQTPSQLIPKEPHPPRVPREEDPVLLFKNLCLDNMRCDTPNKQFGGPKKSVRGAIISIHILGDTIFAIHSDFSVCSYKLHHSRSGSVPFHFKHDRARALESRDASLSRNLVLGHDPQKEGGVDGDNHEDNISRNTSFALAIGRSSRSAGGGNISSDLSHLLMSCGYFDECVKIHSLDSLLLQHSLNGGHRGRINCLEADDEGEILVTGGDDATCRVWIVDHDALATAITDGFVKSSLGNGGMEESRCVISHVLLGHVTPVRCVAVCTKLDVVVSGSESGDICVHNIRSGKFIRSIHIDAKTKKVQEACKGNGIAVMKLAIHIDGSFAAHLSDGSLHVISINGEQMCKTELGEQLHGMIMCPNSETLITGGDKGCARIWRLNDLSLQCTVDVKKNGPITSLALTPAGSQFLCIGCSNGLLSIVSRKDQKQLARMHSKGSVYTS